MGTKAPPCPEINPVQVYSDHAKLSSHRVEGTIVTFLCVQFFCEFVKMGLLINLCNFYMF